MLNDRLMSFAVLMNFICILFQCSCCLVCQDDFAEKGAVIIRVYIPQI